MKIPKKKTQDFWGPEIANGKKRFKGAEPENLSVLKIVSSLVIMVHKNI